MVATRRRKLKAKIATKATQLARAAVETKYHLSRKAVSREVFLRQADRLEEKLVKRLATLFRDQIKSAQDSLKQLKNETVSVETVGALLARIFDPSRWDEDLVNVVLPPMAKAIAEAMMAQVIEIQRDLKFHRRKAFSYKASTASEWLQNQDPEDLEDVIFVTPYGDVSMRMATEFPQWMKDEIETRLKETFSQPYWSDINETTGRDIEKILIEGIQDGKSIEQMADEMRDAFGEQYPLSRGRNIARTEAGNALNGARSAAIDSLIEDLGMESVIKKVWLSVLGNTTRDTHAVLDGVPADKHGFWTLAGIKVRWPGDVVLPAGERCNCQCSLITQFGMTDATAEELIAQSSLRQQALKPKKDFDGEKAPAVGGILGAALTSAGHAVPDAGKGSSTGSGTGLACGAGAPGSPGFQPGNTCAKGGAKKDKDGKYIPGTVGVLAGVDTSSLTGGISDQSCLAKIDAIEQMAEQGDWAAIAHQAATWGDPKSWGYFGLKLVAQTAKNLHDKHQEDLKQLATGTTPSTTAPDAVSSGSGWKQIGPQLGTEIGGTYIGPDGKKYYVKIPTNPDRARNEVLASKLYELAGAGVAKAHLVEIDGKLAIATEWVDSDKVQWTHGDKVLASEDFGVHAWLNNRDAVGSGSENPKDNIRMSKDGKMIAVDVGGSMEYKGMGGGGKKDFKEDAPEWDTLRDPSKNSVMGDTFGQMTPAQLIKAGKKLKAVTDDQIDGLVDRFGPGTDAEKKSLAKTLKARRDAILEKVKKLEQDHQQTIQTGAVTQASALDHNAKIDAAKKAAASTTAPAVPPPPVVSNVASTKVLKQKMQAIYDAAKTGDIKAVEAIKVNMEATSPLPKKLAQYKKDVLAAMKAGGKAGAHDASAAKAATPPKPATPPKIDPSLFPAKPTFGSKNQANVDANNKAADEALKHAAAGDLVALQSMTLPASPKLKSWHQDLVTNLSEQLNPPPAPTKISDEYSAKTGSIGPKAKAGCKKAGKWLVAGEVPGVQEGIPEMKEQSPEGKKKLYKEGRQAAMAEGSDVFHTIRSYTGGGYHGINKALRGEVKATPAQLDEAYKAARLILDHGVVIPEGTQIKRGHAVVGDWSAVTPGTVIVDKGYLSTSVSKGFSGQTQLVLRTGPGVRGIPAEDFSLAKGTGEDEVIFAPNQRILVTQIKKVKKKKYGFEEEITEIHGIILPTLDSQCCPP